MRKEILFTARDEGVESTMERMKRSASELGAELLREAQKSGKSAADSIKYYEEQIKLIEKRNKLESQQQRVELDQRAAARIEADPENAGAIRSEHRQAVNELTVANREDQLQLDLMRELIDTVRQTSREQVANDDKNNQRQEASLERQTLIDSGEEFVTIADKLKKEREQEAAAAAATESSDSSDSPASKKKSKKEKSRAAKIADGTEDIASQRDVVSAGTTGATSMFGANPFIAALAAIVGIGTIGLQAKATREMSSRELAALTGRSANAIGSSGIGGTDAGQYGPLDLNVSREEFLSHNVPAAIRARGTSRGFEKAAMRELEVEKSMALNSGTGASLDRLGRVIEGGVNAQQIANKLFSSMVETGALGARGKDMAQMQEITQSFLSFQESQLQRAGVTDGTASMGMMRDLMKLGGSFKRVDYASQTRDALNSGLSSGGTDEAQAIKYDILRRANPNMGAFELQAEMAKGINAKGFMAGVFNTVKGTGGDLNSQAFLFDALTGGNVRKPDILKILQSGDLSSIEKESSDKSFNFRQRAISSSSRSQTELDFSKEAMQDGLTKVGDFVNKAIDHLVEIKEFMVKGYHKLNPFD